MTFSKGKFKIDKNGKFNLNQFPYDSIGEGFEKFMSDAGLTGGNQGQYFTNPKVIVYVYNRIDKIFKLIDIYLRRNETDEIIARNYETTSTK